MNKFFQKLLLALALVLSSAFALNAISAPAPAYAVDGDVTNANGGIIGDGSNETCRYLLGMVSWDCHTVEWSSDDNLVQNIATIATNILTDMTVLAAYLAIGFVIYGGYLYIFASGDPSKVASGKKTLTRAIIGIIIVSLSNVILSAIRIALIGNNTLGDCAHEACVGSDAGADIVQNMLNWFIGSAGIVSVIFIVIGGVGYMTSAGDSSKLQKAKNTILYALIGLAIVVLAEVITAVVFSTIREAEQNARLDQTTLIIAKE